MEGEFVDFDVAVVGAGVSGLTCALYLSRFGVRTAVFGFPCDSSIAQAGRVDNFPAFSGSGIELVESIEAQASSSGAWLVGDEAVSVDKEGDGFVVASPTVKARCGRVVVATGGESRIPEADGVGSLYGRRLHVCAMCDAPFYKGKEVVVIGGGNSAVSSAICLSEVAGSVAVLCRKPCFKADKAELDRARAAGIELVTSAVCVSMSSVFKDGTERVAVTADIGGERTTLECDGVFSAIGFAPRTGIVRHLVRDCGGGIPTDEGGRTECKGLYCCGDAREGSMRQAVTAAADGAATAKSIKDDLDGELKPRL